jgi:endonuclease/exonuclease/phosphatase family metal-dependent hydrolase
MNRRSFLLAALASAAAARRATNRPASADEPTLRVLTYNVHHGEGTDQRFDLDRVAAVVMAAKPDLVALQEVDRKAQRTGGVDQPAEYMRLTRLHGWFGAAMPFQGGEYGQMLLSRWPLREPRVVRLPGTADREPRIAVTALVDVPQRGRIRWTGLHLDATRDEGDRWEQVGGLMKEFAPGGTPTLLAGDFNAIPQSRVMQRIVGPSSAWEDTAGQWPAPTVPAGSPRARIDYVLASPPGAWQPVESTVIAESVASDHRPLLVVLRRLL